MSLDYSSLFRMFKPATAMHPLTERERHAEFFQRHKMPCCKREEYTLLHTDIEKGCFTIRCNACKRVWIVSYIARDPYMYEHISKG